MFSHERRHLPDDTDFSSNQAPVVSKFSITIQTTQITPDEESALYTLFETTVLTANQEFKVADISNKSSLRRRRFTLSSTVTISHRHASHVCQPRTARFVRGSFWRVMWEEKRDSSRGNDDIVPASSREIRPYSRVTTPQTAHLVSSCVALGCESPVSRTGSPPDDRLNILHPIHKMFRAHRGELSSKQTLLRWQRSCWKEHCVCSCLSGDKQCPSFSLSIILTSWAIHPFKPSS